MKTTTLILATICAFATAASAQTPAAAYAQNSNNLVIDGSFENIPKYIHNTGVCMLDDSITSANNTTVDFYGRNAWSRDNRIPSNYMGTQDPKTGDNYAGIIAFYADETGVFRARPGYQRYSEYIQLKLQQPLTAGSVYTVSFNASLAEKSAYAVSGLGVYFSNTKMDVKNNAFLQVIPHIVSTDIITSTDWTTFTGTYVASGGEQYLTLGCYDLFMDSTKVIPPFTNNSRKAYYYIDDVSMTPAATATHPDDITMILFGDCYQLKNLNFETDKATILASSYDELNSLAHFLKTYPYITVYIDGHTDKTGTEQHNDKLSDDRAASVRDYLVKNGIRNERLKTRGYGESQPIDKQHDDSFVNRRVEITVCEAR